MNGAAGSFAGEGAAAVGLGGDAAAALYSGDETKGLILALSSSVFIGSSFIIKKKGLKLAALTGLRAGAGGHSYLLQPLWWLGTLTMVLGEACNFLAYAFAPAVLVTPLGAISIIVSAVLAHLLLKEKLHYLGWMGCLICIIGSMNIVMNAPAERALESMPQVWALAMQPEFLAYVVFALASVAVLMSLAREHGSSNVLVYIGICSLMGSLSVMSVKALGIALKLTFVEGDNQLVYKETAFSVMVRRRGPRPTRPAPAAEGSRGWRTDALAVGGGALVRPGGGHPRGPVVRRRRARRHRGLTTAPTPRARAPRPRSSRSASSRRSTT